MTRERAPFHSKLVVVRDNCHSKDRHTDPQQSCQLRERRRRHAILSRQQLYVNSHDSKSKANQNVRAVVGISEYPLRGGHEATRGALVRAADLF